MTINKEDLIDSMQMVADFCRTYKRCDECPVNGFCEQCLSGDSVSLAGLMQTLVEGVTENYDS